jgi:hypothetical protein
LDRYTSKLEVTMTTDISMRVPPDDEEQRTLRGTEDRRIEILLEIGHLNREYDERASALREEYAELEAEYYEIRLGRMSGRAGD